MRATASADALARLGALAGRQHGAFLPEQAAACGWPPAAVDRARRDGSWHRVTRGAYVDAGVWERLGEVGRHLCHVHARLLLLPPGWHAAARSAALVHRLPVLGKPPVRPQLVRPRVTPTDRGRLPHERFSHLPPDERTSVEGIPCTSVARAVADVTRADGFRAGVVVADAALRRGMRPEELRIAARRQARWRGAAALGRVLEFSDPRSESALESISRVYFSSTGLPAPELQSEIWCDDRFLARVDFLWRDACVIGESDGRLKYLTAQDLYAEKRREDSLRALGFLVIRWDWDDVWTPDGQLASRLRAAVRPSESRSLAPGGRVVATSLSSRETRVAS